MIYYLLYLLTYLYVCRELQGNRLRNISRVTFSQLTSLQVLYVSINRGRLVFCILFSSHFNPKCTVKDSVNSMRDFASLAVTLRIVFILQLSILQSVHCYFMSVCQGQQYGVPRRQSHRRSGLATVPSVVAIP